MDIFVPGATCWRTETAARATIFIDNETFYPALAEALTRARHSVLVLGWAFDPRTRLAPDGTEGPDDPDEIGRILLGMVRANPALDVRLLIWKSAMLVNGSPDFIGHRARRWFRNTPVDFRLDVARPFGACHHQKVIVIDDQLAFCGGGDIVTNRWDSQHHRHDEPRRLLPDRAKHPARHEVTLMADGAAAMALGELFRERWRDAGGIEPARRGPTEGDAWPASVAPRFTDVEVAIARTRPARRDRPAVTEIFDLTLACIAQARRTIYLENQYFTSPVIAEALAARLAEPDGPEVVLIVTGRAPSWFDRLTMDHARNPVLRRLRAADAFGRFRAWFPRTEKGGPVLVHSKVAILDDEVLRVGSANLNNRSAGFDTECELAIEAARPDARAAVASLRDQLVSHFLGVSSRALVQARGEAGGLIGAIERLNTKGRLAPLAPGRPTLWEALVGDFGLGDPSDAADSWRPWRRRSRLRALIVRVARRG
ncbi:phosphatidylserine/phosphatidylglycerophosphate/cardiolipin synthase-like enzyme [Caulobacter ginsengisoli]|uniref:Phospholipase D n=1 Tax=Caulobacter ginsengisoli TaxID=400775 RepID=A0ABU0IPS0_9CAUL|nr:phospholipase D-like domain-containing protein [Caulobacter ginsengisoli]MDQ0464006.1 phosphatidylserine/phosphatidylglycerophosphate/cardiolipin synthase-like enzyme [Caulobacter ginsengisoli]